jgi:hypothetical protein
MGSCASHQFAIGPTVQVFQSCKQFWGYGFLIELNCDWLLVPLVGVFVVWEI